jgi:nucleoside phosphorylase
MLLISAMPQESSIILNQFSYHQEQIPQGYTLFRIKERKIYLLEIGFGNKADLTTLESTIISVNPAVIINFGICGALHSGIKLNQNYLAKSVNYNGAKEIILSHDLDLLKSLPKSRLALPVARLITVKEPVLDSQSREELRQNTHCELVDMEAYYIALCARRLGIPVIILKQVTDHANEKAKEQIRRDKNRWQETLYRGLRDVLQL